MFSGYMPRMTFKFGATYKNECDNCLDEYMTNRQTHDLRQGDLRRAVTMVPRLTAVSHDPQVKKQLDRYRDTHPTRPMLMGEVLITGVTQYLALPVKAKKIVLLILRHFFEKTNARGRNF